MTFTKEQRKAILEKYLDYVNEVSDNLEDKSYFSAEELVMMVLDIVEGLAEASIGEDLV